MNLWLWRLLWCLVIVFALAVIVVGVAELGALWLRYGPGASIAG